MLQASRAALARRSASRGLVGSPAFFAGLVLLAGSALAQAPAAPDGIWYTKGEESIIKVHPCLADPNSFCGTLVWLKEPNESDGSPKLDKLNKDPVKRTKPLLGVDILLAMKPADDHWKGKAYNPEDGKLYDITFKTNDDKADLRGCVLGFLCQTEVFNRAPTLPGGGDTTASSTADAKKHKPKNSAHR